MGTRYWVVDAFTQSLFHGNPAAVVILGAYPPAAQLQRIAAENNLSETAFLVPKADGHDLRWFTPTVEVELCGHATLASAFVLRHLGKPGPYAFDTRSGRLTARADGPRLVLDFPARPHSEIAHCDGLAEVLGACPVRILQSADIIAVLDSAAAVRNLTPDIDGIKRLCGGVIVTAQGGADGADVTSRYFAPRYGIAEDPVTGSLHTQVVPYWAKMLGKTSLVCDQASARGGRLWCEFGHGRVQMAGHAVLYAQGEFEMG